MSPGRGTKPGPVGGKPRKIQTKIKYSRRRQRKNCSKTQRNDTFLTDSTAHAIFLRALFQPRKCGPARVFSYAVTFFARFDSMRYHFFYHFFLLVFGQCCWTFRTMFSFFSDNVPRGNFGYWYHFFFFRAPMLASIETSSATLSDKMSINIVRKVDQHCPKTTKKKVIPL